MKQLRCTIFVVISLGLASMAVAGCGGRTSNPSSDAAIEDATSNPPPDASVRDASGDASHIDDTDRDATVGDRDATLSGRVPKNHRQNAPTCDGVRPFDEPQIPDGAGDAAECHQNTDCTTGENGRCNGNPHDGWRCTYDECSTDAECNGKVCQCEGGFRSDNDVCLSVGNCRLDADCGTAGYCSPSLGDCGHYVKTVGYYCHTPEDECVDDEDCTLNASGYCAFDSIIGHWKCSTNECAG